jgi:hypothetical protein
MPPIGKKDVHPPEKHEHTNNLNAALSDALANWNPSDGHDVKIRIEASVSPNPGGISQYRVILDPH